MRWCLTLLCVLFASVSATAHPHRPTAESAEDGPRMYSDHGYSVRTVPICGADGCTFSIEVTTRDIEREVLFAFLNRDFNVTMRHDMCVQIDATSDYTGIGDTANAFGPHLPQMLCERHGQVVDYTAYKMRRELVARAVEIEQFLADTCLSDECLEEADAQPTKALVVELLAIREIFFQAGFVPPHMPTLHRVGAKSFEQIELGVVDATMKRLVYRGLAN